MNILKIGVVIIGLLSSGFGFGASAQCPIVIPSQKNLEKHRMKLLPVGQTAPDWRLTDPAGKVRTLADYRGKVVVLDFWATWCETCAEIMPRMQKLHDKLADKGVVVLGVNTWEKGDPIAFMKKKRLTYDVLLKGEEVTETYRVT